MHFAGQSCIYTFLISVEDPIPYDSLIKIKTFLIWIYLFFFLKLATKYFFLVLQLGVTT